jgi:hypothetical protein
LSGKPIPQETRSLGFVVWAFLEGRAPWANPRSLQTTPLSGKPIPQETRSLGFVVWRFLKGAHRWAVICKKPRPVVGGGFGVRHLLAGRFLKGAPLGVWREKPARLQARLGRAAFPQGLPLLRCYP